MAQEIQGNLVQIVGPFRWIQQVRGDHGVKDHTLKIHTVTG